MEIVQRTSVAEGAVRVGTAEVVVGRRVVVGDAIEGSDSVVVVEARGRERGVGLALRLEVTEEELLAREGLVASRAEEREVDEGIESNDEAARALDAKADVPAETAASPAEDGDPLDLLTPKPIPTPTAAATMSTTKIHSALLLLLFSLGFSFVSSEGNGVCTA